MNKPVIFSFLVMLLAISLIINLTYAATTSTQTTPSNATVSKNVAVSLSTNLSEGIKFGAVDVNTNNNNATGNYDGGAGGGGTQNSSYYISVDTDSNINIDLCIRDEDELNTTAGNYILNGNYTWEDNSTTNSTEDFASGLDMDVNYLRMNVTNIAPGSLDYFRFWLDVPSAQTAGEYNNTVYFKGVETGVSCGT